MYHNEHEPTCIGAVWKHLEDWFFCPSTYFTLFHLCIFSFLFWTHLPLQIRISQSAHLMSRYTTRSWDLGCVRQLFCKALWPMAANISLHCTDLQRRLYGMYLQGTIISLFDNDNIACHTEKVLSFPCIYDCTVEFLVLSQSDFMIWCTCLWDYLECKNLVSVTWSIDCEIVTSSMVTVQQGRNKATVCLAKR